MQLFSSLLQRMSGRLHARRSPAREPTPRFRPRLEALEARWLPSPILTVTNTLDSGKGSFRYEIAHADKNRDTIVFAPGLSGQTITLTSGEVDITTSLTVQGPSPGAAPVTISGGGASRVFEVEAGINVTLNGGLTITDGDGVAVAGSSTQFDGQGGGILNLGTLTVSGCTLSGTPPTTAAASTTPVR
jgi:hypothetical protein